MSPIGDHCDELEMLKVERRKVRDETSLGIARGVKAMFKLELSCKIQYVANSIAHLGIQSIEESGCLGLLYITRCTCPQLWLASISFLNANTVDGTSLTLLCSF